MLILHLENEFSFLAAKKESCSCQRAYFHHTPSLGKGSTNLALKIGGSDQFNASGGLSKLSISVVIIPFLIDVFKYYLMF